MMIFLSARYFTIRSAGTLTGDLLERLFDSDDTGPLPGDDDLGDVIGIHGILASLSSIEVSVN
jgi:hypothetical protein